jgi:hypothetical protein
MSERANALITRLSLKHKLPGEALDAKEIMDSLLWRLRISSLANSELSERHEEKILEDVSAEAREASPKMLELNALAADVSDLSPELGARVAQLVRLLVATKIETPEDLIEPSDMSTKPRIDYTSDRPAPGAWKAVQRDHATLLALVRGYRFLVESSDESLQEYYPSRLALVGKIRGVELKAISSGTEI